MGGSLWPRRPACRWYRRAVSTSLSTLLEGVVEEEGEAQVRRGKGPCGRGSLAVGERSQTYAKLALFLQVPTTPNF